MRAESTPDSGPESAVEWAAVDDSVRNVQARGALPGLLIGVVRHGALAHVTACGAVPVATAADVQSRIGSISKTLTAALVLALRDDGVLDLDEPIARRLPGLDLPTLTARQLLAHVSGLRREPTGPDTPASWWERTDGGDVGSLLAAVGPDAIVHRPYTTYHYSNLGYGLLGALVEAVAGKPWREMLALRLLEPLGMDRTTYDAQAPHLTGYVRHPYDATLREEPRTDTGAMAPAGQLWSTLTDLARWAAFLADPDPHVLAPATVDEMCAPAIIADPDAWRGGHGLGVELWRERERVYVGHTGSMPGYLAVLAVHRSSGTGVVGFANAYTLREGSMLDLAHDVLTDLLDRDAAATRAPAAAWTAPRSPAPGDVADLLGRWWWMGRGYDASWDADTAELVLTFRAGYPPWRFTRVADDTWRGTAGMNDGEALTVRRDADGRPAALDIATFLFAREPGRD